MTYLVLNAEKSNERGELVFEVMPESTGGGGGPHTHPISDVVGLSAALALLAPLASPAFTGTPTAPTAAAGTSSTAIATTAFVMTAYAALLDSAPATLDTLNELAAALNDDPNFATTVTNLIAGKAPLSHSHAIADVTGLQTALNGKSDTGHVHAIADVTGLQTALNGKAPSSHSHAIGDLPIAASGESSSTKIPRADDARLSDARTPTGHSHTLGDLPVAGDGETSSTKLVRADDSRLSGGGGSSALLAMIPKSGQYLQPSASAAWGTSAGAYATGAVAGVPIPVPKAFSCDGMACRIATNEAGIPIRLLLYSSDADGHPSTLVASGTAAAAGTGAHVVSFTAVTLNPGVYWAFIRTDAGSTIRFWALASNSIVAFSTVSADGAQQRNPIPRADVGTYASPTTPLTISDYLQQAGTDVPFVSLRRA